jgi:hypothetical protein
MIVYYGYRCSNYELYSKIIVKLQSLSSLRSQRDAVLSIKSNQFFFMFYMTFLIHLSGFFGILIFSNQTYGTTLTLYGWIFVLFYIIFTTHTLLSRWILDLTQFDFSTENGKSLNTVKTPKIRELS